MISGVTPNKKDSENQPVKSGTMMDLDEEAADRGEDSQMGKVSDTNTQVIILPEFLSLNQERGFFSFPLRSLCYSIYNERILSGGRGSFAH